MFTYENDLLITGIPNPVICVPQMPKIVQALISFAHDSLISGHRSIDSTLEKLKHNYFWVQMTKHVTKYIRTCDLCQRNKSTIQKAIGLLQSLPIPIDCWTSISVDFITYLPITPQGYNSITVFVDRFTKQAHFTPSKSINTAEDFANLFLREIV